ncbi:NADH-quinone oxidoreductase subunit H [Acidiferrimicrobium sp. IK]|uniref:respiratory chain complex I subunit 1 family protein n=1 Tax=Acidiferrimicrobium sp. IK TaxID=2871700 RepID=UPI0021CAFCE7|nr:NADH-quinone oxidoreductase subunit H [Acidiferrimicrobium sp. IK]MCU4186774.1 NADH-quinone oxidoreductase subunit H [Acidiferrimicrobium sp. IK]
MNPGGILGAAAQTAAVGLGAPGLVGGMRQVRARMEGRAGPGVAQPYRDLRKLLGKQSITPEGTTVVFAAAPAVIAAATLVIAATIPLATTASPLDGAADLLAVVGLLLIGTVSLVLAGLDTGTPFGGMGASRETTIAALVEPTVLLAVFALSIPAGSSNLAVIVADTLRRPSDVLSPAGALAFAAIVVVIIAETGRLPVDNPATHLELTMVHEAMVLEYSGPKLAVIEWGAAMRLTVLLGLLVNLFAPWGVAGRHAGLVGVAAGLAAVAVKVAVAAAALAAGEVYLAKIRLFRVPELLAGSFLLGLLAVTASYFLASPQA